MKARKLPKGLRILFSILTVMLCFSLFSGFVQAILLADVRILTQEDNLKTIVNQVFFGGEKEEKLPAAAPQAVGGMTLSEMEIPTDFDGMEDMVLEMIYEMLAEQFGEEVPFTLEEVEWLVEESTLPDFMSEKIAGIVSDVITGESTTTLTGAEVAEQLELNKDLIREHFGFEVTEEYKNEVASWVDEANITGKIQKVVGGSADGNFQENMFSDGVINGLISGEVGVADILSGGVAAVISAIREVASVEALAVVAAECAILIILLFVVNMKQMRVAVRAIGITAILASLPFFVGTVLANFVPTLFGGALFSVVQLVLQMTAVVPIVMFLIGMVLVIVSVIMTAAYNKRLKAYQAQPV